MTMEHFKIYCEIAISKSIVKRATKVSLIVGTALNIINQGDTLISMDIADINLVKFFLTYLIPYSVTTYTATAMKIEFQIGTKAVIEADLKCKGCGAEIHIMQDELIPECPTCGIHTQWKLK